MAAVLAQTGERFRTTTTMGRSATSTSLGQALSVTAEVIPDDPARGVPGGEVAFLVDGVAAGEGTVPEGAPSYALGSLVPRAPLIAADYGGQPPLTPCGRKPAFPKADTLTYLRLPLNNPPRYLRPATGAI